MGNVLQQSALLMEVGRIMDSPGSPYFQITAMIHCGGKNFRPLQILRFDETGDYRDSFMDNLALVVSIGAGTLKEDIGPYQDDIKITISEQACDETGKPIVSYMPVVRTYRAYLGEEVPHSVDTAATPTMQNKDTGNLTRLVTTTFILEEVAIEQLRKMSFGFIARARPPHTIMEAILSNAHKALQLGTDEEIVGLNIEPANNTTPRDIIAIPDGTPLLEIPDLIQNKRGGIYSGCLGFYIRGKYIHTWSLYNTKRQSASKRLLRIFLSPTRFASGIDKTWVSDGRALSIFSVGVSKVLDDSLGELNKDGNAVRFADSSKILSGMGEVKDNKFTMSRSKNNSEFSGVVVGNGQNYAKTSVGRITDNIYLESGKLTKRNGALMVVPWRRSDPTQLVPGMPVELFYESEGIIKTIEGTLVAAFSSKELEGSGPTRNIYRAATSMMIFIDRNSPEYMAYMRSGGAPSPTPGIGNV